MTKKKWTSPLAERMHQLIEDDVDITTRTIFFWDDVEEYSICDVIKKIKYFESLSEEDPITLVISTHGGLETEMFALYDIIKCSPCQIITIGIGKVMSAGPLILAAGDKRLIYPTTQIMIHEGWEEWAPSGLKDIETQINYFKSLHKIWCNKMEACSVQPFDFWWELTDHEPDLFFGAEKALEFGLVDAIIDETPQD